MLLITSARLDFVIDGIYENPQGESKLKLPNWQSGSSIKNPGGYRGLNFVFGDG
jgi:hypothetical protein